ncbi:MAG TPA: glycosyltransferase [Terriglobales bacterium]|nr:glycosyltransferase [Terriglobales bacterium]
MKIVIFGLTVSSSWGNGHATIWRGLCNALARQRHQITFFEKDVIYYANHRDLNSPEVYDLVLYPSWTDVRSTAKTAVAESDVAVVTSYCPDAVAACDLVLQSRTTKVFYDLDTAVTIENYRAHGEVDYIPSYGLMNFDLVLSYVGGRALSELRELFGASRVAPLYGSVDPEVHRPVTPSRQYNSDLSYLGTYAADRQETLRELFLEPAQRLPDRKFLLGGAQYPDDFPWNENVWFVRHVPPPEHPAFYSSSRATLNVTRGAMATFGYCPSGRLFEAAACETPVVSDSWEGLEEFFEPGSEILLASSADNVVDALSLGREELRQVGKAARERVLSEHTADHRAREFLQQVEALV